MGRLWEEHGNSVDLRAEGLMGVKSRKDLPEGAERAHGREFVDIPSSRAYSMPQGTSIATVVVRLQRNSKEDGVEATVIWCPGPVLSPPDKLHDPCAQPVATRTVDSWWFCRSKVSGSVTCYRDGDSQKVLDFFFHDSVQKL